MRLAPRAQGITGFEPFASARIDFIQRRLVFISIVPFRLALERFIAPEFGIVWADPKKSGRSLVTALIGGKICEVRQNIQ